MKGGLKGFVRKLVKGDAVFNGFLRNNKKNGHGKMINGQNDAEFSGLWHNGKTHGSGVLK